MGRAPCCDKNGLKKGPWTEEEDQKLVEYIQKHGYGNWKTLAKNAGLQRCGKSCRLRWTNYLRPDIKRGRFTLQEEETIIQLHSILGNKWSAIASHLPGRTDNEIKNHWNTHIRKRLLRLGIDPVTHSPRLDLLDISSILSSYLYNSSFQINMSRFLGMQPLVNPELLGVQAQRRSQNLCSTQNDHQHYNHDQLCNPQIENQIQRSFMASDQTQEVQPCSSLSTPCVSYPSSINNFSSQYAQLSDSTTPDYVPMPNYNGYTTDQIIIDPRMSDISGFHHSNSSNQSFGFTSVLSTPSSSSIPMDSHSNSTYACGEDEIENYRSNDRLKFEGLPRNLGY